jgi:choline dehydrogenase
MSPLQNLGFGRYEAAFRENEIDKAVLPGLTADDFKDLNVELVAHRRRLLDAITGRHVMPEEFDFAIVGGGSAGAVIASRLSEDPSCRVALIEAGERPPDISALPIAPAAMQLNPATDWMFTAEPGKAGLGLVGGRVPVPRGKMLGGSSGINYMMYVRGNSGDFDAWAEGGAAGWSYADVLPYFKKSEGLAPTSDIVIDAAAHNTEAPLGVSVRDPILPAAQQFVEAAVATGMRRGDYNGGDRESPEGVVSLTQFTTRGGRRSSTYQAFLAGEPEHRPNLTIITGARVTRLLLKGEGERTIASGVEYRSAAGEVAAVHATKEVILSAGAIGSPQLLLLSGIGPRQELEKAGIACLVDAPHVGKNLQDHAMCPLIYLAPGLGVTMNDIVLAMGPDALRGAGRAVACRSCRRCKPTAGTAGIETSGGSAVLPSGRRADAVSAHRRWPMQRYSARAALAMPGATISRSSSS